MLIQRVRAFAARHALWSPETRLLATLSGGGDSVALVRVLRQLAEAGDLQLVGAVHVHHHIRGVEADADEQFCRAVTDTLGVPLRVVHRDVPGLAAAAGQSLEVAGREARQAAFLAVAGELGADRIATAHTRDDQAETVLLRAARGTGVSGLAAIRPNRGPFVRPLLDVDRAALRAWLRKEGQSWREDATNDDLGTPRNRLRAEVLPLLIRHLNPAAGRALARLADIAAAEDEVMRTAAAEAASRVLDARLGSIAVDRPALAALPVGLARRVVRQALETLGPDRAYDLDEVDLVREAAADNGGRAFELRGIRVERNRAKVVLMIRAPEPPRTPPFRYELQVPGTVTVQEAGCIVEAEGPMPAPAAVAPPAVQVAMVAGVDGAHLVVRSRIPGDRLRLPGGGTKLQDLFVNRKISPAERDRTPIVTDAAGRIVWVGGVAVAEEFRVSDRTKAVIILKLRRL